MSHDCKPGAIGVARGPWTVDTPNAIIVTPDNNSVVLLLLMMMMMIKMLLWMLGGVSENAALGNVFAEDADDWDIVNKTFTFVDQHSLIYFRQVLLSLQKFTCD